MGFFNGAILRDPGARTSEFRALGSLTGPFLEVLAPLKPQGGSGFFNGAIFGGFGARTLENGHR